MTLAEFVAQSKKEYEPTEALKVTRTLLMSCKEHILGMKLTPEQLREKITYRITGDGLKIKNMTDEGALEYLVAKFYPV